MYILPLFLILENGFDGNNKYSRKSCNSLNRDKKQQITTRFYISPDVFTFCISKYNPI